jgi:hypothetical protein
MRSYRIQLPLEALVDLVFRALGFYEVVLRVFNRWFSERD